MKKLFKILLSFACVFTMAACSGSGSEKDAVQKVAEDYLSAVQSGDNEKAAQCVSSDLTESSDLATLTSLEDIEEMFSDVTVSDEAMNSFRESCKEICKAVFTSWTVDEVSVDGEEASVVVTITGVDPDDLTYTLGYTIGNDASEAWYTENEEELTAYLQDHTEEEALEWMYNSLVPFLGETMVSEINKMDPVETQYKLGLKKEDDAWKISSVQIKSE